MKTSMVIGILLAIPAAFAQDPSLLPTTLPMDPGTLTVPGAIIFAAYTLGKWQPKIRLHVTLDPVEIKPLEVELDRVRLVHD